MQYLKNFFRLDLKINGKLNIFTLIAAGITSQVNLKTIETGRNKNNICIRSV